MQAVESLKGSVGVAAACRALSMPRSTLYRRQSALSCPSVPAVRPSPQRALTVVERQEVLDVLRNEHFADKAPQEVYAILLDEGVPSANLLEP